MTTQETPPEWFRSIVLEATLWNARERHIDRLWYELFKPENTAKIPEVAKLIEACEPEGREVPNTILGEGFTVFSLNREKIEEALKPFKKEGE